MRVVLACVLAGCSVVPDAPAAPPPPPTDALETVPELIGAYLRHDVPVTATGSCDGPAPKVAVPQGDVPVLTWTGPAGTWTVTDPPSSGPSAVGEAVLPAALPLGVHRACVVNSDGSAAVDLDVTPAPSTQISLNELAPDGTNRWRSVTGMPVTGASATSQRWMMSDFQHSQAVRDDQGRTLSVAITHDDDRRVYRFDATLAEPVPVGSVLVLDQRGIGDPLLVEETSGDEFVYRFTHSPSTGVPTRRVELFRLPLGAALLEHPDFDVVRDREGRVELLKTVTVPPGGTVTTTFRYRLAGARIAFPGPRVTATVPPSGATDVDPKLRELRVTFDGDMRDRSWSWVQVDPAMYPRTTGDPSYVDPRTCVLPVKLEPGKDYVVWINKGRYDNFKDAQGRSAKPYELRFRTAGR